MESILFRHKKKFYEAQLQFICCFTALYYVREKLCAPGRHKSFMLTLLRGQTEKIMKKISSNYR